MLFCEKRCSENFLQNSQENTCARVSFLIKLQISDNFIKKETDTNLPVNVVQILRTSLFIEHLRWMRLIK